ncbi:hypothetical protein F-LCD7_0433 [Faustovirus]|nr:hypothetical protein F-LCD7_0433 [Faustovirus]
MSDDYYSSDSSSESLDEEQIERDRIRLDRQLAKTKKQTRSIEAQLCELFKNISPSEFMEQLKRRIDAEK